MRNDMNKTDISAKRARIGALLGNAVEYYDQSLYAYLAPFLAPVFFPTSDPVIGLILTYLLIPLGFISRPIGAYFIGDIGDYVGRKKALMISIVGMAVVTFTIGCLPTYAKVGAISPILLILCRVAQSFFVGAEFNGGAIYTLEHTPQQRHGIMSGLYSAGTVVGMLAASLIALVVSHYLFLTWRFPFFLSFLTTIVACYLRYYMVETPLVEFRSRIKISFLQLLLKYKIDFLRIIIVAGLFNTIYTIPTIFLNTYIPMISNVSIENMLLLSSISLLIYMGSLVIFGVLSDVISVEKIMKIGALCIILLSYPLFCLLYNVSIIKIAIFKGIFAIIAGAFNGGFHAWVLNIFQYDHRYRGVSLGYSLGSQIIGGMSPPICFWLWQKTQYIPSPSFYLMICGAIALCGVSKFYKSVRLKLSIPS